MALLTTRGAEDRGLLALYLGAVRVGYVQKIRAGEWWRWVLIMLRPEGKAYDGFVRSSQEGVTEATEAVAQWMQEAGVSVNAKEDGDGEAQGDLLAALEGPGATVPLVRKRDKGAAHVAGRRRGKA